MCWMQRTRWCKSKIFLSSSSVSLRVAPLSALIGEAFGGRTPATCASLTIAVARTWGELGDVSILYYLL
jgi:hypothetical protein